jgi:hypothetical protein
MLRLALRHCLIFKNYWDKVNAAFSFGDRLSDIGWTFNSFFTLRVTSFADRDWAIAANPSIWSDRFSHRNDQWFCDRR